MNYKYIFLTLIALFSSIIGFFAKNTADTLANLHLSTETYNKLQLTKVDTKKAKPILIAVIDDGFQLSHNGLKNYTYTNSNEIPHNLIDDDKNGFIDDINGWDISDGDNNVTPPTDELMKFYHGTFISSTITRIIDFCINKKIQNQVKILPIKAIPDNSSTMVIKDGYQGIKYATKMGADIICCAWSGGTPSADERAIVNKAIADGILIVASAGNAYLKEVDYPANSPGVLAITALDTLLKKRKNANCGIRVDLALPGEKIKAAHPITNNAWYYAEGTSAAAGLATGLAAVLKTAHHKATSQDIIEALKNTTEPIDHLNMQYCGLLGSGLPQLKNAIDYLQNPLKRASYFNNKRPQGTILINRKSSNSTWDISPNGTYHSFELRSELNRKSDADIDIKSGHNDSTHFKGSIKHLQEMQTIEADKLSLDIKSNSKHASKIHYRAIPIDSATLYCNGITHIKADSGLISDNSNDAAYTNNSTCTWHIEAPNSKHITFEFSEFATEAKVDYVWLFDGFTAHPDYTIAKFSGDKIPPVVTSRTNQVMVWFVTDDKNTSKGWTLLFFGK